MGTVIPEEQARPRGRKRTLVLCFLAAGFLGWSTWFGGPRIVRAVVESRSIQRVEGHAEAIHAAALEFELDPCLIAGIMYVESRGQVDAVSSASALGLMQLSQAAAGDAARKLDLPTPTRAELLSDAALNIRLGCKHLVWLLDLDDGHLERVLISYNAGRQKLFRWIRQAGSYEAWRAKQVKDGDSAVLAYARNVVRWRDHFRKRGVLVPE